MTLVRFWKPESLERIYSRRLYAWNQSSLERHRCVVQRKIPTHFSSTFLPLPQFSVLNPQKFRYMYLLTLTGSSISSFYSVLTSGFQNRVRTRPENPGKFLKPWKSLETPGKALEFFFIKLRKISQNFIEKINSRNGAFCWFHYNQQSRL